MIFFKFVFSLQQSYCNKIYYENLQKHKFKNNFQGSINSISPSLLKKFQYSELFRSAFARLRTKYGEIRNIYPYSVQMRENMDQNNSEYGHF